MGLRGPSSWDLATQPEVNPSVFLRAVGSSPSPEAAAGIGPAARELTHVLRAVSRHILVALKANADAAPRTHPAENQCLGVSPGKT